VPYNIGCEDFSGRGSEGNRAGWGGVGAAGGGKAVEGGRDAGLALLPVVGERALLFSPRGGPRTLVVGDLHLGIETDFARAGVKLPSAADAIVGRVEVLRAKTGARVLVIAGDLKHSVKGVTAQEGEEVPRALGIWARSFARVVWVPGNHDGAAPSLVPPGARNVEVAHSGGYLCRGGLLVVHGHAWPDRALAARAKGLVVAHNHCAVALEDALGRVAKEPCWARARVNPEKWREAGGGEGYPEVVLMPPFNELCTGVAVNIEGARPIGPLLREGCVDLARAEIYLLDGVWLGKVEENMIRPGASEFQRLTRGISEDL